VTEQNHHSFAAVLYYDTVQSGRRNTGNTVFTKALTLRPKPNPFNTVHAL